MEILSHDTEKEVPITDQMAPRFADPVIALEHYHRYLYAERFVTDKRVLDIACREGYGSAFLSIRAGSVVGVDADEKVIERARKTYGSFPKVRFEAGRCEDLKTLERRIDVTVSFDTIEHLE